MEIVPVLPDQVDSCDVAAKTITSRQDHTEIAVGGRPDLTQAPPLDNSTNPGSGGEPRRDNKNCCYRSSAAELTRR
jgi:hypothetical protein